MKFRRSDFFERCAFGLMQCRLKGLSWRNTQEKSTYFYWNLKIFVRNFLRQKLDQRRDHVLNMESIIIIWRPFVIRILFAEIIQRKKKPTCKSCKEWGEKKNWFSSADFFLYVYITFPLYFWFSLCCSLCKNETVCRRSRVSAHYLNMYQSVLPSCWILIFTLWHC